MFAGSFTKSSIFQIAMFFTILTAQKSIFGYLNTHVKSVLKCNAVFVCF